MTAIADVDYSKVLISDVATDGGLGTQWVEIQGVTRQGTASLAGSDSDITTHKDSLGQIIKSSTVKGDVTYIFQCADISAANRVALMGGTIETSASGTNYKAPSVNQAINKSIMIVGRDGTIDYAVNVAIDAYLTRSDDDLAYIQVNGTVEKPEKADTEPYGSWDDANVMANDITSFVLDAQTGAATINDTARTVAIEVANGTTVTALIPTVGVSIGANATPNSLEAQDFTSPVEYTVKSADGTGQVWTVTVTVAA